MIRSIGKHKGDYLPAHNFKLEIDGVISGGFKEITGIGQEVEVITFKDGDDPTEHKRAGKAKVSNIIIRKGQVNDHTLLDWFKEVVAGKTNRKSVSILYLDREGKEVYRYNLYEAWPCRWKAPELNSQGDNHAVEEIEFVAERIEKG